MESGSGERVPGTQLSRARLPGPSQPSASHPSSLFLLSPASWEVGMQPSWERHSVQAAQGTLHVSPKRIPAGGPRPLHPHHDLGLRQAPWGGRGQAAEPPGASVSSSVIFFTKLNQIMRAGPQNSIWRAVRHLMWGALIYYYLLSLRSPLRLSLLCQCFQRPQNHPGSFVEDTA